MWWTLVISGSLAHAEVPSAEALQEVIASLREGEVVRVLERSATPGTPSRALGLLLSDVPRDQVWISCQDPHFIQNSKVVETVLSRSSEHEATWFGLLALPSPFADRVWVVDVVNNHSLAMSSDNRAWEHSWEVHPEGEGLARQTAEQGNIPGVDKAMLDHAIFTPTNQGAWLLMEISGSHSLFGYHSSTELAGNLPTNLVMQFVHAQLESMLGDIVERGRVEVQTHYNASHGADVAGGDGRVIPRWSPAEIDQYPEQ
jgi:hypothetical protein